MPISELQLGLIGAGAVAVVGVFAYSKWQERRHRKQAERVFSSDHRDVLLDTPDAPRDEQRSGGGERIEPGDSSAEVTAPVAETPRPVVTRAPIARQVPDLPADLDPRVDCAIRIETIEPLEAGRLWLAQREHMADVPKTVTWFALDDESNTWVPLGAHSAGRHNWFCVGMQMADRRGAMDAAEFGAFVDAVQRVCDAVMAVPATHPARNEVLQVASDLDRFCAGVDVQIGVNVVSNGTPFPGTKLRGVAEAGGLVLRDDGMFHAEDESGVTLFSLANLEPDAFQAEGLRDFKTHGVTLVVDVPRVPNGHQAFDRMMEFARHLASVFDGQVVDDNRAPFGEPAAAMIRNQIEQFQGQMQGYGVPAGGRLALRLFSAG
ncbi:MAG: cell division protein ZipA C-terminal FtsZ-binding domain-containing protein [Zoogloeaceae bacterium]|nr:cell division protein ZipA C-terminal FtsZ-binding domain-containing protein [Zoogloeaceae bacterium]